jgi:hypothetical protein
MSVIDLGVSSRSTLIKSKKKITRYWEHNTEFELF